MRAYYLQGSPLILSNIILIAIDYLVFAINNSGLAIIIWLDNSVVQSASNFVGVGAIGKIDGWCNKTKCL